MQVFWLIVLSSTAVLAGPHVHRPDRVPYPDFSEVSCETIPVKEKVFYTYADDYPDQMKEYTEEAMNGMAEYFCMSFEEFGKGEKNVPRRFVTINKPKY